MRQRLGTKRRLLTLALAGAAAMLLLLAVAEREGSAGISFLPGLTAPADDHPHARPVDATVWLARDVPPVRVPRSFFGLSMEYWALPYFARELPLFERVLAELHAHRDGPLLLRIGGDSADHSFWDPSARAMPDWAYAVTPNWLARASALVRETGARLILDLNLVTATPGIAGEWARAALGGLPRGSVAGFEIGNEPDIYDSHFWRSITAGRFGGGSDFDLPRDLTAIAYARDFLSYARVLSRAAPGVPLVGPALANPVADHAWLTTLLRDAHRSLSLVSIHRYPYTGCVGLRGTSHYPTIKRLLSDVGSTEMAALLRPLVADAQRYRLPLRLTELNSVNCGGRPGVSNSFASALWAPDALFALLRAGVSGVNLHVRSNAINAPFSLGPSGLTARPLLYGLITFVRALGSDSSLVGVRVRTSAPVNLHVWAVRPGTRGLNVLLINKSWRPARVRLALGDLGPLRVERLIGPSPAADGGVTLGGQRLSPAVRWVGRPQIQVILPHGGVYAFTVRKFSAALALAR